MLRISSLYALYFWCTRIHKYAHCISTLNRTSSSSGFVSNFGKCITPGALSRILHDTSTCNHKKSIFASKEKSIEMDLYKELKSNKTQFENLLKRRFFFLNSFEIYGGTGGLFDYGPPGCALKTQVENLWRQHFIIHDEMLEVSCPCITPYNVLEASGHVDKFTDLMLVDLSSGECFRADKYLEDLIKAAIEATGTGNPMQIKGINPKLVAMGKQDLEKTLGLVGNFSMKEIAAFIKDYEIKSPAGNALSEPFPFNLMFKSTIGPKSNQKELNTVYLRPETAQGIFVNFTRLLEQNGGKIPFAAAQIGLGFRNEISPRNGLLRAREFLMAEIEYFVHPKNKIHQNFGLVKEVEISLLPRQTQESGEMKLVQCSIAEAVAQGIVANEALGYFMGRTLQFLQKVGINSNGIRFRQHMSDEMAHYACDCWDAEILTSYGWIEVVGHADRMAFDLQAHSKATNTPLVASVRYDEPIRTTKAKPQYNRALIGKCFGKDSSTVISLVDNLTLDEALDLESRLANNSAIVTSLGGQEFTLTREMVKIILDTNHVISQETFTPAVIEPSFGIGRLIYCILEHAYRIRPAIDAVQEARAFLSLAPPVAPIKCAILPLSAKDAFEPLIAKMQQLLANAGISYKIDKTGASIGRRYARNDEIGIPFAVTIDFDSLKDDTVTLRQRDSMEQVRLEYTNVVPLLVQLIAGAEWSNVTGSLPKF
ncbi:bifunctional Anticodon-binding/Class II Aminoacyl-tRNA synthetase-Biotinyl protein ligase (BPL) and lipoyl protein ligase (LPL)/Glycyl-tRNA synthetase-like core domain/Glycyl-tRNA synthetase-DNA polymerase subunit gamma-2/Aminoacyl-tRNA synthetase [Babesia duncani]|uniref:glycine--tRNA ligase n=1 Tax=Babesia duncani TaxID=323732 RepID=A0AAD9PMB4_9APIC|nr:bifunctional Anticodon-binding/Class II Aminoacyl-tRNA synthetase-Biotinyl protein ligase (BPL) and lipoyl protein ligase (LPL)/Glycyl-tRNA synthetase-like core domain/Glycyl-tRNA synthetase-DNA polymerase subunit gamma-2/Aminoacyl-tRNA synthetase [Babesia duncani]